MWYKENWEETRKHFEAFWNRSFLERCNLAIAIPKRQETGFGTLRELPPEKDTPELYSLEERYTLPECIHAQAENNFRNKEFLFEALPAQYLNFGTAGQCEYFGCRPNYAETTIWFEPVLKEADCGALTFTAAGRERFRKHKEIAAGLAELSNGRYFASMPDNCGIIDSLAAIRGTENLLMDMLENPEFVHEARNTITAVWKETQKEFFEVLRENNLGGSSHGWMQLWSPGTHVQIQCDFSVMISPGMFEEFVLPELIETSEAFEHTTYHLDGIEQLRHLDMILSVKGIDNIQWTPVAGQPKTSAGIEALRKIQRAGKGLVLIPGVEEVGFLMENLSHEGLHLIINGVKTKEEAEEIEALARKLAHKGV